MGTTIKFVGTRTRRGIASCTECRRRKKRCNELKPQCSNCAKRKVQCTYGKSKGNKENKNEQVGSSLELVKSIPMIDFEFDTYSNQYSSSYDTSIRSPPSLDIEFKCHSIINDYISSSELFNQDVHSYRFSNCYKLILPLTFENKTVLFTITAWILSINKNSAYIYYLNKSQQLTENTKDDADHHLELVVIYTIYTIVSAMNNDTLLWKQSFERLYDIFQRNGVLKLCQLVSGKTMESMIYKWAIIRFFFHDTLKMMKVSKFRQLGPVFSKRHYIRLIENGPEGINHNSYLMFKDIYMVLGELKTFYDEHTRRIDNLNYVYSSDITPTMENMNDEQLIKFVNSPLYLQHERQRADVHAWVKKMSRALETRINDCRVGVPVVELVEMELFLLIQLTCLLFLKFKIMELPPPSPEIQDVVMKILEKLRSLVQHPAYHNRLLQSLVLVSANVCVPRDRMLVKAFYLQLKEHNDSTKLRQLWKIVNEFWELDPTRVSYREWQEVTNKHDWNVCII